jgi:RNA polymerase sigma-70 factor (ECF subfamily)
MADARDLAAGLHEGDALAFSAVVAAHQPQVFRWALALSGDADEADDITQEVFVRVFRKRREYRGEGSFEGWLYRITSRVAGRARRKTRLRTIPSVADDVYTTDPGARVDRQRAVALIRSVAESLPMRQREVFVLCDLEGRTPAQAADMLEMKDVSVRASLFKARAAIRRRILATHPCYREDAP